VTPVPGTSIPTALQAALDGRFLVEQRLGQGGMGAVYLARDIGLDRPVAIKQLHPQLAAQPAFRARFLQEARTAARLAHPHIVPIHAVEERGEVVCFVMGYIPGVTLAERVRTRGPLPPAEVTRLIQEVAWALAYAHRNGVIHRDVKPENILLERGTGRALVTDFGIARLTGDAPATGDGELLGTPRMVSPEQAAGEPLDGRSDLYSLGVVAFFALTGRYPFEGDTAGQLLAQHLTMPAPPVAAVRPGVPRALAQAVDRCLSKPPEARYANGEELAVALQSAGPAPAPRALRRILQEMSDLGVDLVGFATLAAIALTTQALTRDFLGFGFFYTGALAALLVSLVGLRGLGISRTIREAVQEGWTAADLRALAEQEARSEPDRAPASPDLRTTLAGYVVGLAALAAFWIGPKQWIQAGGHVLLSLAVELVSLALPVALGRWLGQALEAPRRGRPGWLSRFFLRFKSGWIFRLFGRGASGPAGPGLAIPDQPTEVLLADQARELLRALPSPERERLDGAGDLLLRLERNAVQLRRRLADLDRAAGAVGQAETPGRRAVEESLRKEREETVRRFGAAVSALDTLRLELVRARAGLHPPDGLTQNLETLRKLTERIDDALDVEDAAGGE
jgi:eukaryotic-like serine/threonine-protein kinase